jgi:hypothetical protein
MHPLLILAAHHAHQQGNGWQNGPMDMNWVLTGLVVSFGVVILFALLRAAFGSRSATA